MWRSHLVRSALTGALIGTAAVVASMEMGGPDEVVTDEACESGRILHGPLPYDSDSAAEAVWNHPCAVA